MIASFLALPFAIGIARAGDEAPGLRITGISHVALRVSDLPRSLNFYRDLLGLEAVATDPDDSSPMLRINDRQYLELRPGLVPSDDRLDHVAFQVEDVEEARRTVTMLGLSCLERSAVCIVEDAEGHDIELMSASSGSASPALPHAGASPVSSRLLHVGLLVGALEESRRFYERLGFRETWRGSRSGTELSWTNMQVPDGEDYVEFMLYAVKPSPHERGTQHHVCLQVPDIEAARTLLERRATAAGYSRPLETRIGTNRRRQMNLYDPDGTRVELMEPQTVDGKPVPSSTAPPPVPAPAR